MSRTRDRHAACHLDRHRNCLIKPSLIHVLSSLSLLNMFCVLRSWIAQSIQWPLNGMCVSNQRHNCIPFIGFYALQEMYPRFRIGLLSLYTTWLQDVSVRVQWPWRLRHYLRSKCRNPPHYVVHTPLTTTRTPRNPLQCCVPCSCVGAQRGTRAPSPEMQRSGCDCDQ
jgi:hypothetical protein